MVHDSFNVMLNLSHKDFVREPCIYIENITYNMQKHDIFLFGAIPDSS